MASHLPSELWAKVFSFFTHSTDRDRTPSLRVRIASEDQTRRAQLQLVCRKFKTVFQMHPDLASAVVLRESFADHQLPSLLKWTGQRTDSIETFIAGCTSPLMDIALAGLGQQVSLKTAICRQCSGSSLHLLSRFSTLKHCLVSAASADLTPLGILPALCCLELYDGTYHSAQLPPGLLTLSLDNAHCHFKSTDDCIEGLQEVTVSQSKLSLKPVGIAACAGLRCLQCVSSSIISDDAECDVRTEKHDDFYIPSAASVLTCLTKLVMRYNGSQGLLNLDNIYGLRSLQCLELCFDSADADVVVSVYQGLTALRHLARLKLTVADQDNLSGLEQSRAPHLMIDVNWAALYNLQHIFIRADNFQCDRSILQILAIKCLRTVEFRYCMPYMESSTIFASLAYGLARCRPDVRLKLDSCDLPMANDALIFLGALSK